MDFDILDNIESSSESSDEEIIEELDNNEPEDLVELENLIDPIIYNKCINTVINPESVLFTEPKNTTNTIKGSLSNILFHEENLIKNVVPDEIVTEYHCNFGKVTHWSYKPYTKVKKTNRGRKRKPKVKKNRKQQGNGTDLNSQITMIIRSIESRLSNIDLPRDADGNLIQDPQYPQGIDPEKLLLLPNVVLKPKIFRNGKIQIPGLHLKDLPDIAEIMKSRLRLHFPECEWQFMNLVMSNYRWRVKMPDTAFINMKMLAEIIARCVQADRTGDPILLAEFESCENRPKLFDSKTKRENATLSIKFRARTRELKTVLLNIFRKGKTNVQGIYDVSLTVRIWKFMHWIFENYPVLCYQNNEPAPYDNVDNTDTPFVPHQFL
jgi:hypothetical protein